MEKVLNVILGEFKNINSRLDKLENRLQQVEEGQKAIREDQRLIRQDQEHFRQDQRLIREEFKGIKEWQQVMASRHDEMYRILKGWEEDRPVTKKKLDELLVDMAKMKNHKHRITLDTEKAEAL